VHATVAVRIAADAARVTLAGSERRLLEWLRVIADSSAFGIPTMVDSVREFVQLKTGTVVTDTKEATCWYTRVGIVGI
jgi:hypothetical protein